MGRQVDRLSARKVQTLATPGRHADGGGLYLVVTEAGTRKWAFLYRRDGKRREMGLGALHTVPLARAREKAAEARALLDAGGDPIEAGRREVARETPPPTFGEIASAFVADRETIWRNAKHRMQWRNTLETYAAGLWGKPVAAVGTDEIVALLRPIWIAKPETAQRVRGRIERVLDAARIGGHRVGENPARWRGHLALILPPARKLVRGHLAAISYAEVPAFVARLRALEPQSARALEFLILTAARSGEVRGMTWAEVDTERATWTAPAVRMKRRREHRVPLCERALAILADQGLARTDATDLVFPSRRATASSDMVFTALLRRMGRADITTHGFRSAFRDWVEEETEHPAHLAEAALSHLTGDETERAYRRGDVLAKRRGLMDDWAQFCGSASKA